jgi:tetratricopeptide (TPR) repeat protein
MDEAPPKESEAHYRAALRLAGQGQFELAIQEYHKALALEMANADYHSGLGQVLTLSGTAQLIQATKEYDAASKLDPDSREYPHRRAAILAGVQNLISELKSSGGPLAGGKEGEGPAHGGLTSPAPPSAPPLPLVKPDEAPPKVESGHVEEALAALKKVGETRKELRITEQAVRSDPESADTHYRKALALEAFHRVEQMNGAVSELDEAIRRDPRNALYHDAKGRMLLWLKRLDGAVVEFDAAISADPANAAYHFDMACALMDHGMNSEALADFQAALILNSKSAEIHFRYGLCLAALGRKEEAIKAFDEAIKLMPTNIDYRIKRELTAQATPRPKPKR